MKRILALLLLLSAVLYPCNAQSQAYKAILKSSQELIERGDYARAEIILNNAIAVEKETSIIRELSAMLEKCRRERSAAARNTRKDTETKPLTLSTVLVKFSPTENRTFEPKDYPIVVLDSTVLDTDDKWIQQGRFISIPEGEHHLSATAKGFNTTDIDFKTSSADTLTLDVVLIPEPQPQPQPQPHPQMDNRVDIPIDVNIDGVIITIDRQIKGKTPTQTIGVTKGSHTISFTKDGYAPQSFTFDTDTTDRLVVHMKEASEMKISSDVDNLVITLTDMEGNIVASDLLTPSSVYVPYGLYTLELHRQKTTFFSKRLAYRGTVNFDTPGKEFKRTSNSANGNSSIFSLTIFTGKKESDSDIIRTGQIGIGNIGLFDGFTTSILQASLYSKDKHILSSFSPALFNGAFRIGGATGEMSAVSLLAEYSYQAEFIQKMLTSKEYAKGVGLFIGAEMSSCAPSINMALRVGITSNSGSTVNPQENTVTPFNTTAFTIGLSLSFGGNESKGPSILRLF